MKKLIYILVVIGAFLLFIPFVLFVRDVFTGVRDVSPYLLKIGNFGIKWYSFFIAISFVIGLTFAHRDVRRYGINEEHFDRIIFWSAIGAFVGARLYHVFSSWSYYKNHPGEIIKTWHGGLAIYGAVIGAVVVAYLLCKKYRINFLLIADIASPWLIFGQALGRWGNFFNHEAYGIPTNLPWKMFIPPQYRFENYLNYSYYHPTFLYESIWNFGVFAFLLWLKSRKNRKTGDLFFAYIGLYSIGRFWVEFLRFDTWRVLGIKIAHVIAILFILISALWFLSIRYKYSESAKQHG